MGMAMDLRPGVHCHALALVPGPELVAVELGHETVVPSIEQLGEGLFIPILDIAAEKLGVPELG